MGETAVGAMAEFRRKHKDSKANLLPAVKAEPPPVAEQPVQPPEEPKPVTPKKPKPLPDAECVIFRCNHRVSLKHFRDTNCPECKAKDRAAKGQRNAAKRLTKADYPGQGRLPDGSVFHASYDAAATLWTGSMLLLDGTTLRAEAGGIMRLCKDLDVLYRQHLAGKEQPCHPTN